MDRLDRATLLYERLLLLYPAPYRARFGAEMRQNFRDLYRDEARRGRTGGRFWAHTLTDVGASSLKQYGSLIRNQSEMKQFFSNNAKGHALLLGVLLMVPAGVFFLVASGLQLVAPQWLEAVYAGPVRFALPVALIGLPLAAVVINTVPVVSKAVNGHENVISMSFVKAYFWSIAIVLVGLGWLAFLFGHDTLGCAVQNLPLLHWQAFQHCAATH